MAQTMTERSEATRDIPPLTVDFLYFEGCPSHERALQTLREVLQQEGVDTPIHVRRVDSDEEAEDLRFPGSPTIRVNGYDIADDPALPVGLSCRAYRTAEGRISPFPPRERIVAAVRQALHDPQIEETGGHRSA